METNPLSRRSFINKTALSVAGIASISVFPVFGDNRDTLEIKKYKFIQSVSGKVASNKLGRTLMHEHILFFGGPMEHNVSFEPIPENLIAETIDFAVAGLNDAARVGIDTIVDLTPHRPIELYEQIAKRTTVNIIVSTGFYRRSKSPKWLADMADEKQMEDHMLKEVSVGIGHTKIKAGIIKIAGQGNTDWQIKTFKAAAKVSKAKGTPIATHSGDDAFDQFKFLTKAGVNPSQILLSHVDVGRKGIPGNLLTIVKEGGYLEVDTFGQEFYTPWAELTALLRNICEAGFANRIIIDVDHNWHWENGKKVFEGAGEPNFDPNAADRTFSYMMTYCVPKLLKAGFSMKEIDTFLIENPRSYLSV